MRIAFPVVVAFSGSVLALAGTVAPAAAEQEPDAVVRAEMVLDCASLEGEALDYALDEGFCSAPDGEASAEDVRWSVCGYSYLYIYNEGAGRARWEYGYGSTLGVVFSHDLNIDWTNHDTGISDAFWDTDRAVPSPAYSDEYSRSVGRGEVTTAMLGTVDLVWGGSCQVEVPTARAQIT